VAFHVDHAAIHIKGDGFEFALSQQLSEDLEVDFSQHVGGFVTGVSQKTGYCFRLFDRNIELIDEGIALQKLQSLQFINSREVATQHGFDVVHFYFVGRCIVKHQIVINQVKNPIHVGVFEQ